MNQEKKKRVFELFDDNFENIFNDVFNSLVNGDIEFEPGKPLVMGLNIRMSGNGKPVIERFGNVREEGGRPMVNNAREPLVDVTDSGKEIIITVELPGVERKDLEFSLKENCAIIDVGGERNFYKELALPSNVNENTAKAKFKNGILEIRLEKKSGKVKIQ